MRLARSVISVGSRPSERHCLRDAFIIGTFGFEWERPICSFIKSLAQKVVAMKFAA